MADGGQGKTVSQAVSQVRSLCKKEREAGQQRVGCRLLDRRMQDARAHSSAPDLEEGGRVQERVDR